MMQMQGLHIMGMGHYVPEHVVTNEDISQLVETNDEWIRSRTGIKQRYFSKTEMNHEIAGKAAQKAILDAGIAIEQIDACVVATVTPYYKFPSVACMLQKELGLREDCACFDLNAACSGFIYGLQVAKGMLLTGAYTNILLVGSEVLSNYLDMTDRSTCILFGDGAGAAVLSYSEKKQSLIKLGAMGEEEMLYCNNTREVDQYIHMQGNQVFKFAVKKVPECIADMLKSCQMTLDELDYIVCHQANSRIIEYVAKMLQQPMDKFYMNVGAYGNTSAASIPMALSEMKEKGLLKRGMKIICVGFGGGLTWGTAMLEW